MSRKARLLPAVTGGLVMILTACADPLLAPPTAQEVAAAPSHSGLRDAHFIVTGHITSGAAMAQVSGDGLMTFRPGKASRMALSGSEGGRPFHLELLSVDGTDYQRGGTVRWSKTSASPGPVFGDGWSTATDLRMLGEDDLRQGSAWHVAGNPDGQAFELWVRRSDGYPLKCVSDRSAASWTLMFDRFDTGEELLSPAPDEIKPDPKHVTGLLGQPIHLNDVDLLIASADVNYKPASKQLHPRSGYRFVVTDALYQNTGPDSIIYGPIDWTLTDGQGVSYAGSSSDREPALRPGELGPNGKVRGLVAFEVPTTARGLIVTARVGDDTAAVSLG